MQPFQVIAQCPHCKVEGASLETFDHEAPCCHFGVPVESICRMCARATQGGVYDPRGDSPDKAAHLLTEERCPGCDAALTDHDRFSYRCNACGLGAYAQILTEPQPLQTAEQVEAALRRWATAEGYGDDLADMLEASFCELSVAEIHALIESGEVVPTSFDVLGFLFSHMSGGVSGFQAATVDAPTLDQRKTGQFDAVAPPPDEAARLRESILLPSERPPHPRNGLLPLISVMVADGVIRPAERQLIDAEIQRRGLDPLRDDELRVWRPHEVGPVGPMQERERLVELMIQLAHVDDEKDATEMRLVREFALIWGVDPNRIDAWEAEQDARRATPMQQLWSRVKALILAS